MSRRLLLLALSFSLAVSSAAPRAFAEDVSGDAVSAVSDGAPPDEKITASLIDDLTWYLVDLTYRPSVEEVLAYVPKWIMTNKKARAILKKRVEGFRSSHGGNGFSSIAPETLDLELPNHIAGLELVMPGATYAYLGRDSALPADLVEGFYRYLGQQNRGVRLNASTSSFKNASNDIMNGFLQTNGLDFEGFAHSKGFFVIDVTSYRPQSQSSLLVNNAIAKLKSLGYSVDTIVKKFNLGDLHGRGHVVKSASDRDKAFGTQQASVGNYDSFGTTIATPLKSVTYSAEWHATFRPFKIEGDKVVTSPGANSGREARKQTLAFMLLGLGHVMQDEFVDKVVRAAKEQFGYSFPEYSGKVTESLKRLEAEFRQKEAKAKMHALAVQTKHAAKVAEKAIWKQKNAVEFKNKAASTLKSSVDSSVTPPKKSLFTLLANRRITKTMAANSEKLVEWFNRYNSIERADINLLQSAFKLYNEGKIGVNDLTNLLSLSMSRKTPSPNYLLVFKNLAIENASVLREIFKYPSFYLGAPMETSSRENAAANFQKLKPLVPAAPAEGGMCRTLLMKAGA